MSSNYTNTTPTTVGNSSAQEIQTNLKNVVILCQAAIATMLAVTLWMLISMAIYGRKAGKWKNTKGGRLYITCFVAIIVIIPNLLVHVIVLEDTSRPGSFGSCELLMDFARIFNGVSLYVTYSFLWLRQRSIYNDPLLLKRYGKCFNVLSWTAFGGLAIVVLALMCGYTIPNDYLSTEFGCAHKSGQNHTTELEIWVSVRSFVTVACIIFIQGALLFLFAYPILQNRFQRKNTGASRSRRSRNGITKALWRSAISTLIAVISDIVILGAWNLGKSMGTPLAIIDTIPCLDALINNFCILATFKSFKTIICCRKYARKTPSLWTNMTQMESIRELNDEK